MLSVRDLVRQIPAEWQENVKHRAHARRYAPVPGPDPATPSASSRIAQLVLGRAGDPRHPRPLGRDLPPERVHLVTVPPPGGAPTLLWERFARPFGLDGHRRSTSTAERANPSLGVPETALVRRINRSANDGARARRLPAAGPRAARPPDPVPRAPGRPRLALPPDVAPVGRASSSRPWVEEIARRGYDVVGDLDDLRRRRPRRPVRRPRPTPTSAQVRRRGGRRDHGAAARGRAAAPTTEAELHAELDEAEPALERAYLRPSYRGRREAGAPAARRAGSGRGALAVYRRARGRSSRSA